MDRIIKIFLIIIIFTSLNFAQTTDFIGLNEVSSDSSSVKIDTLMINSDTTDSVLSLNDSLTLLPSKLPLVENKFLNKNSFFINNNVFKSTNFRYIADILNSYPLSFLLDRGIPGAYNELKIYGAGFNNISFLQDGLLLNHRLNNSFNLYSMQTNHIDSIEIIPSYQSFIYGNYNNLSSVNFITRENYILDKSKAPYTRIQYYQAPNEEAMIDFLYHAYATNKLKLFFNVTNRTADTRFTSLRNFGISDFNISNSWNIGSKVTYLFSNKTHLGFNYRYIKNYNKLFGGIDTDSLYRNYQNFTDLFFSEAEAPLNYYQRYLKTRSHYAEIFLLNEWIENISGKFSVYFKFDQDEFRNNEYDEIGFGERIFNNNKYNLYGIDLRNNYTFHLLELTSNINIEQVEYDVDYFMERNRNSISSFKFSSTGSLKLLDSLLIPKLFGNILVLDGNTLAGAGAEVNFRILNNATVYSGFSSFNKPLNIIEKSLISNSTNFHKNVFSFESGLNFTNKYLTANLIYFFRSIKNELLAQISDAKLQTFNVSDTKIHGIGANLNFYLWKIFMGFNPAYYYSKIERQKNNCLPELTLKASFLYRDVLFDESLYLTTGFLLKSFYNLDLYSYDFEKSISGVSEIYNEDRYLTDILKYDKPVYTIDFSIIGTIQERATLYFTIENILDKKYYIVPVYPMFGRGMKLGFSWEFIN